MFSVLNHNTIYDILGEEKIVISLTKSKVDIDVSTFLDDISLWMDKNRPLLTEKYLPFSFLSVGSLPQQISAFMFGIFVGKAIEKHGLKLKLTRTHASKDQILKEIKDKEK